MSLTAFGFLTSSDSSIPRTGSCNRFLKSSPRVLIVYNVLFKGLSGSNTGLGHALVPVVGEEEKLDTGNFRKETNSASFVFFNGADISICLMLWVASALLLIGINSAPTLGPSPHWSSFRFGPRPPRNSPALASLPNEYFKRILLGFNA